MIKKVNRGAIVLCVIIAIICVGCSGAGGDDTPKPIDVQININCEGWLESDPPVQTTITGVDGYTDDISIKCNTESAILSLLPGDYELAIKAVPILADGTYFAVPSPTAISVNEENRSITLDLVAVPDDEMSTADLDAVVKAIGGSWDTTNAYDAAKIRIQLQIPMGELLASIRDEVSTITATEVLTEETDPNRLMNKPGGYIERGDFIDSRTDPYSDSPAELGVDGGGAFEKFASPEEAATRNEYIGTYDGMSIMSVGAHEQLGIFVLRSSDNFTATQQKEMIEVMKSLINAY